MRPATALPPVCVLAGGRGTRLGGLTRDVPKPLIPVAGRAFIDWPLLQLRAAGFDRVVLSIGYHGHQIREHVGSGQQVGLHVDYVDDGPIPLGTLGALRAAAGCCAETMPVMYADTILTVDFADVVRRHISAGSVATMTVLENRQAGDVSNAVVVDGYVSSYRKVPPPASATWIDYGFLVFCRDHVQASRDADLAPFLTRLAGRRELMAYVVEEPFREVGTPEGLMATDRWLRNGGLHLPPLNRPPSCGPICDVPSGGPTGVDPSQR